MLGRSDRPRRRRDRSEIAPRRDRDEIATRSRRDRDEIATFTTATPRGRPREGLLQPAVAPANWAEAAGALVEGVTAREGLSLEAFAQAPEPRGGVSSCRPTSAREDTDRRPLPRAVSEPTPRTHTVISWRVCIPCTGAVPLPGRQQRRALLRAGRLCRRLQRREPRWGWGVPGWHSFRIDQQPIHDIASMSARHCSCA